MKSRDTLIRLKKFQVDEKRRRVAQIEGMIADFQRMTNELEREIQTEQERAGISDPSHFAYPTYADMEELIRLGAYRAGSSPEVDEAIRLHDPLEAFLRQAKEEKSSLDDGYRRLAQILANLETER
jgi:flagellar biosynthesis/type III secretory pathway ATPase